MWKLEHSTVVDVAGKGYGMYRIPSVAVSGGVTLIAREFRESADDMGRIVIGVSRSTDGGVTFGEPVFPHRQIADRTAWDTVTWNNPVLIADGDLFHYIFCSEYDRMWYCRSENGGESFSDPVEISEGVNGFRREWTACAAGPGHGVRASDGRLVVPVWVGDAPNPKRVPAGRIKRHQPSRAGCIISDDRGKTWRPGFLTSGIENANECQAVELPSGVFLFNFRHTEPQSCRILGVADRELTRLTTVRYEPSLPDPRCMGSMSSCEGVLYFSNCANGSLDLGSWGSRVDLTLYESRDDGGTWQKLLTIDELGGYSDIAADGGGISVFYERGKPGAGIDELIFNRYSIA